MALTKIIVTIGPTTEKKVTTHFLPGQKFLMWLSHFR